MISEASFVCACSVPAPLSGVATEHSGGPGAGKDKEAWDSHPCLLKPHPHVCSF